MSVILELVVIASAAVAAAVCVARLADRAPPRHARRSAAPAPRHARRSSAPASQTDQLVRLERLVGGAQASALHVHAYLRPVLVEIAARRLAARGRALDRLSDRDGRGLLGESLWEVVRPDRPFPSDRHAPGVPLHELDAMLSTLERL